MSEFETLSQFNFNVPNLLHIVAVIFFVTTGTIFNGIILYIQHKKTNRSEMDIYIVTLACIDVLGCLVIVPQYPLLGTYQELYKQGSSFALRQFFTIAMFTLTMCLGSFTAIALIRVNAVFRPFTFVWSTQRSKWIVVALFLISFIGSFLIVNIQSYLQYGHVIAVVLSAIQIPLCFILMTVSYLAIFVRLHRQSTKFDKYSATDDKPKEMRRGHESTTTFGSNQQREEPTAPAEHTNPTNVFTIPNQLNIPCDSVNAGKEQTSDIRRLNKRRGKTPIHMKTLKMFFVLTVLFVILYIPLVCEMKQHQLCSVYCFQHRF